MTDSMPVEPAPASDPRPVPFQQLLLWGGFLVALVVLVYWPTLKNGYVWDDDAHVIANTALRSSTGLHDMWLKWGAIPQYYPLVHTTFWIEYHLWGLNPLGYHLVNMLLHATSCILLWRVLVRLQVPGAWFAAALFAVHPVEVESVAWISERKNVLSLVFALGSILSYLKFAPPEKPADSPRNDAGWSFEISLALFVAALLSKTVTATVPGVLLVIYWWKRGKLTSRDFADLALMFVFGLGMAAVTVWLERSQVGAAGSEWNYSLVDRILIAGHALWFYAGKLVWPHPLVFFYPRWNIDAASAPQYLYPIGAAALLVSLYLARHKIGRGPLAAVLIFMGAVAPALGFFNVYPFRYSLVADHFQYHASIGLLTLLAAAIVLAVAHLPRSLRWIEYAGALLVLLPLAAVAHHKTLAYHDLVSLYSDILTWNPQSWVAHINLADYLDRHNNVADAIPHYREGLEILTPDNWHRGNLSRALEVTDQIDAGIEQLTKDLDRDVAEAEKAEIHRRLGDLYAVQHQPAEAILQYEKALEIEPNDILALVGEGTQLAEKQDWEGAVKVLSDAVERSPANANAHYQLGRAYRQLRKPEESLTALAQAVQLNPNDEKTRVELATILFESGQPQEAVAQIEQTLTINRRNADAMTLFGRMLLLNNHPAEAAKALQEALNVNPKHAEATALLEQAKAALAAAPAASSTSGETAPTPDAAPPAVPPTNTDPAAEPPAATEKPPAAAPPTETQPGPASSPPQP